MGFLQTIAGNNKGIDAKEAEAKIRNDYPCLLGANEHIESAFKGLLDGRDKNFFTTHRILIKYGKGVTAKKKQFVSISYESIKAFSVQTAGASFLDTDTELKIWYDGGHETKIIDFAKDMVNLFEVQQFFNSKVFSPTLAATPLLTTSTDTDLGAFATNKEYVNQATNIESIFNWVGNNAIQIDPKSIEDRFGFESESPILIPGEKVEIAYQARRDVIILTPIRLLVVDVKGLSGKKIEFLSVRWKCVKAFSVETVGTFDFDGHFVVHTNIASYRRIRQDLREGKADMFQVQMAFANKLFGGGTANARIASIDQRKGYVDVRDSFFGASNNRPLDATEVERVYRSNPCLLQTDEYVEMAFRGIRDLVIFTTKRIIDIDVKGLTGKNIKYTSIPYSSIIAFAVRTAGKIDRDAEVIIYTEIRYNVAEGGDDADPGLSCIEWDFNKNLVNVLDLKRYLNARLLATERGIRVPTGLLAAAPKEHGLEKVISTLGEDQRVIDSNELDVFLRSTNINLLMEDENVVMAFKAGRDISCFTNKRIFIMDKKGFSGKKIEFISVPYSSVRAFSAESAGGWDRDSTVKIFTKNYWSLSKITLDFRKGKADIVAIQNFLSAIVLGNEQDAANYLKSVNPNTVKIAHPTGMNGFTDMIFNHAVEEDPKIADAQLHSNPPILLDDERVEKVYRMGRDLWVFTTLRILKVDVKGMSGKKINNVSIPFDSVTAFGVNTAGYLDWGPSCFISTNIPDIRNVEPKLLENKGNIFDIHEYLGNRMFFC